MCYGGDLLFSLELLFRITIYFKYFKALNISQSLNFICSTVEITKLCCDQSLSVSAVPNQSEWNKDQKRGRPPSELDQVLPRAVQVSDIFDFRCVFTLKDICNINILDK